MTGPVASPTGLVHQVDMIARLFPDRFVLMLLGAILLGWLMPATGGALDVAQQISNISIFALFFLHGLRLPRKEVLAALKSWKLQAGMLAFTFLILPLAGWGLAQAAGSVLPVALLSGVMYCAMLPSTVQSAISYSSMANGNIAGSVVGAAISNLVGIIATPLLVAVVIGAAAGVSLHSETIMRIATMLILPFALGQLAQSWMGAWAVRQKRLLSFFDRLVIVIAVYVAFSAAVASGSLAAVDGGTLLVLMVVIGLLLHWQAPWHAAATAALLLGQGLLMRWFLQKPVERALFYSGFGVPLFVAGMMVSAFALRGIIASRLRRHQFRRP
jgi:sodium/bile acid cotransporter 7